MIATTKDSQDKALKSCEGQDNNKMKQHENSKDSLVQLKVRSLLLSTVAAATNLELPGLGAAQHDHSAS